MAVLVTNNNMLAQLQQFYTQYLQANSWVRLYTSTWVPTVSDSIYDYIEAVFPGYAPEKRVGPVPPEIKESDGWYEYLFTPNLFFPTANSALHVNGFFVTYNNSVLIASAFDTPQPVVNAQPIALQILLSTRYP